MNAFELQTDTRAKLESLMQVIQSHPYLTALESKRVDQNGLRLLATQQYHLVTSGIRNIAIIVSRFGHQPTRQILREFLEAEFIVRDRIVDFGAALGLTEDQLRAAPKNAKAMMFSYFMTALCQFGSDGDLILAFRFDSEVWIHNSLRVYRALRGQYEFTREQAAFFNIYQDFRESDERVAPYLQAALDRGESPTQMQETARLLLEYELMFWDAMYEASVGRS